jgi:hypothetical protein
MSSEKKSKQQWEKEPTAIAAARGGKVEWSKVLSCDDEHLARESDHYGFLQIYNRNRDSKLKSTWLSSTSISFPNYQGIGAMCFQPFSGNLLVCYESCRASKLYSLSTPGLAMPLYSVKHNHSPVAACFLSDGGYAINTEVGTNIYTPTGRPLRAVEMSGVNAVTSISRRFCDLSVSSMIIALSDDDGNEKLAVWSADGAQKIVEVPIEHPVGKGLCVSGGGMVYTSSGFMGFGNEFITSRDPRANFKRVDKLCNIFATSMCLDPVTNTVLVSDFHKKGKVFSI